MNELTEALANYAHKAWSGWMRYLFEKSAENDDGTVTIPRRAVERWQRQMNTAYADLPESEKKSDRDEARKIIEVLISFFLISLSKLYLHARGCLDG